MVCGYLEDEQWGSDLERWSTRRGSYWPWASPFIFQAEIIAVQTLLPPVIGNKMKNMKRFGKDSAVRDTLISKEKGQTVAATLRRRRSFEYR